MLEAEEEARQAAAAQSAALPPAPALPLPKQLPAADIATAWNTAFPWAGPASLLIDLTGTDADSAADEDA